MSSAAITADAAGTWTIGDLTVHRVGFGAMRLTGSAAFHHGTPSDRDRSIAVLRRAVELVPRQATFAPSRRPARPLAAPAESPSTSSTRASGR
ncbi:hypothetical protein ABZ464_13960, partial [Streptomyces sp. NPDC005820]